MYGLIKFEVIKIGSIKERGKKGNRSVEDEREV